ncbi:MAG: leucine-rich repeat protein [Eubacterium sp.]|nr:leucine-rich repeat protein [Eubacterium sp.]
MLKTDSYIDDKYLIADETLISLSNPDETLVIPSEVNGHRIRRIGSGFYVGDKVKTVMVSEGITEIGDKAFLNSKALQKVILPESLKVLGEFCFDMVSSNTKHPVDIILKRSFSANDYNILLQNSIETNVDKLRILTPGHAAGQEFADIYKGLGVYRTPRRIECAMQTLCIFKNIKSDGTSSAVDMIPFRGIPFLWAEGEKRGNDFRIRMMKQLLRIKPETVYDEKSEQRHDRDVQMSARTSPRPIILTEFAENGVVEEGDRVIVVFQLIPCYAFYSNLIKVTYHGKNYYISRDNYLNPEDEEYDYFCKDQLYCIIDEDGRVPDEGTGKAVIAKYRFSMMLN